MSKRAQIINLWDMIAIDQTLFADFKLDPRLNRDTCVNRILKRSGHRLPQETDTKILKYFINGWFDAYYDNISRLYDTVVVDYDPIENYYKEDKTERKLDRIIDSYKDSTQNTVIDINDENKITGNSTNTRTDNLKEIENNTRTDDLHQHVDNTRTDNLRQETKVSAFDTESYQPKEELTNSGTQDNDTNTSNTGTQTTIDTKDNTGTQAHDITNNQTTTDKSKTTNDTTGNITGTDDEDLTETITTTSRGAVNISRQTLLEQTRKLQTFNIYDWIANEFDNEFMVGVF